MSTAVQPTNRSIWIATSLPTYLPTYLVCTYFNLPTILPTYLFTYLGMDVLTQLLIFTCYLLTYTHVSFVVFFLLHSAESYHVLLTNWKKGKYFALSHSMTHSSLGLKKQNGNKKGFCSCCLCCCLTHSLINSLTNGFFIWNWLAMITQLMRSWFFQLRSRQPGWEFSHMNTPSQLSW